MGIAGPGTYFRYNGVSCDNVLTEGVVHEAVFDETNVNQVSCRVTLTLTGIMHTWPINEADRPFIGNTTIGTSVNDSLNPMGVGLPLLPEMRAKLEALNKPRKELLYAIGSTVVYFVLPASSTDWDKEYGVLAAVRIEDALGLETGSLYPHARMCVNNGPKVKATITRVINQTACWVRIEASFEYIPCESQPSRPAGINNVMSLRWRVADDINIDTWRTKRVFTGSLRTKYRGYHPMLLRYLAIPAIQRGWKPAGYSWSEDPDNLGFHFTIAFEEISSAPPAPASSWDGDVVISAPMAGLGVKTIDMSLSLRGPESVPKMQLVYLMLQIFDTKIGWYDQASYGGIFTRMLTIRETIGENEVSGTLSVDVLARREIEKSTDGQGQLFHDLLEDVIGTTMDDPSALPGGASGSGSTAGGSGGSTGSGGGGVPLGASGYSPPPPGSKGGTASQPSVTSRRFIPGYDRKQATYWLPAARSLQFLFNNPLSDPCDVATGWGTISNVPSDVSQAVIASDTLSGDRTNDLAGGADGGVAAPDRNTTNISGGQISPVQRNPADAPYMHYVTTAYHDDNTGIASFPLARADQWNETSKVGLVNLHYSNATMAWKYEAARLNRYPGRPNKKPWKHRQTGIVFVPTRIRTVGQSVEVSVDGRKLLYRTAGIVEFAMSRSFTDDEMMFVGIPPTIVGSPSEFLDPPDHILPGTGTVGSFSLLGGAEDTLGGGSSTPPDVPPAPTV